MVQQGLVKGITLYTVAAAVLLAYAGIVLKMVGSLLWPAVRRPKADMACCTAHVCFWARSAREVAMRNLCIGLIAVAFMCADLEFAI